MATIKQVAEAAGVKPATVSYVLNGTGSVSTATRERVLAAAAALDYTPSHLGRSLQRRRSNTLGLVLPSGGTDERLAMLLSGIADGATASGYDLLLASQESRGETATYRALHRSRRVDGLIVLDVRHEDERVTVARELGIAYVCGGKPDDGSPYVAIDVEAGALEALAHLVVLGHERIGLLTPPLETTEAIDQDAAYHAALAEAGLLFDEQLVVEAGVSEDEGYAAANDLFTLPERPTAILVGSAALAFGAMHAAHDAGLRLGVDLALVVLDDPPSAEHIVPALTAVRKPTFEVGHELARLLVGIIEEREQPRAVLLQSQLIVRRSCGQPIRPD
jgi:LacI family transcriptional regulator